MVKRSFPVVAAAALAVVLASAGTSRAQMGGFWGGWGTMSPWSGTGGWTYWPGGIGINYQPGIYSGGGGYGFGGMGGMGYGGMGLGTYPGYPFGYNATSVAIAPMNYVAYYPPVFTTRAPVVAPTPAAAATLLPTDQPANVEVIAPADAVITFNGQPTKQTGTHRLFTTPPLAHGESYHYTVQATFTKDGKSVTQKQRVAVFAGGRSAAVFPLSQ